MFAKTHPGAPAEFFTTEAAGLTWLRDAGAIAVPAVLAVSDDPPNHLVLEWIDEGPRRRDTERSLGAALADLHRCGAPSFGREDRRTTGSRGLPNEPCATWSEFYATQRLLPLARLARDASRAARRRDRRRSNDWPAISTGSTRATSRRPGCTATCGRATGSSTPRARSWLIDPAAHGGHREFDLAMMRLFGGFGPECFAAYAEAYPLAAGWEDRVALHQIAPLVVHAIKFGGGYVDAAAAAIERSLAAKSVG